MRITPKGELVIPKEVCEEAGFPPGVEIEAYAANGQVTLRKAMTREERAASTKEWIERLWGSANCSDFGETTDEIMSVLRGRE